VLLRTILMLLIASAISPASATDVRSNGARQLILVLTSDWNATQGTLRSFEWRQDRWVRQGRTVPISIGRTGAAWGIGLHEAQPGLQKKEGDGRSPAGIFSIGRAFGYATSVESQWPYDAMTEFDYCIDVNESPLYNQIVDARKVGSDAVAKSTEPMRRDIHAKGDRRYEVGFVIEHNPQRVASQGSCIFAHLWASAGQVTAGCTAMEASAMRELLAWLDSDSRPVFVLLPHAEYERLKGAWGLPILERAL
jgi:L,D-peptidoglycan transpeptidase YkuD (ErfK/YbiS/YcfS/YnhG family)